VVVDASKLKDGPYYISFSAPGLARQWSRLDKKGGFYTQQQSSITLFKKRYAIVQYAVNGKGERDLTGANVEEGECAVAHESSPHPAFARELTFLQGKDDPDRFGPTPWLRSHLWEGNRGFASPEEGAKYEDMREAPAPAADAKTQPPVYSPRNLPATKGRMLYYFGQRDDGKNVFAKLRIKDIVTEPPKGMKVVDVRS
jgi:hypothetical protein